MSHTERVGISLDKKLLNMFDELIARQGYSNRSEAVRDLIRAACPKRAWQSLRPRRWPESFWSTTIIRRNCQEN